MKRAKAVGVALLLWLVKMNITDTDSTVISFGIMSAQKAGDIVFAVLSFLVGM